MKNNKEVKQVYCMHEPEIIEFEEIFIGSNRYIILN